MFPHVSTLPLHLRTTVLERLSGATLPPLLQVPLHPLLVLLIHPSPRLRLNSLVELDGRERVRVRDDDHA